MSIDLDHLEFGQSRVLVVGDVMLDRYLWGNVHRISPEAPVPVFHIKKRSIVPGGAGNVVLNLIGLGVSVTLIGIMGEDENGSNLSQLLKHHNTDALLLKDRTRPTITKTRIVSIGQQLLRIDDESNRTLEEPIKMEITERACKEIPKNDAVILSDYGKGIFQTPDVTENLIKAAKSEGVPVLVDPKGTDWQRYAGATCVTPNTTEFEQVFGKAVTNEKSLLEAMDTVRSKYLFAKILLTRGSRGMCLLEGNRKLQVIHAIARQVYDVSGAGDTVIATLAAGIASGLSFGISAQLASIAAGVVVGKLGTQPINILELKAAVGMHREHARGRLNNKVHSLAAAAVQLQAWKADDKKIVFTNGCFDLLHPGHVYLLNKAKDLGDCLVVGLNSDGSVRRLKGSNRPILNEHDRASLVGSLECVDLVVVFDEDTPESLIKTIRPNILVKGADYRRDEVVGREIVESLGGQVKLVPVLEGFSTTDIANKILENYKSSFSSPKCFRNA
jgi:D-beta-D-heptose 7-phosphate kinase/D-beta-D-heptose 1-phosphate adenosyltransferase